MYTHIVYRKEMFLKGMIYTLAFLVMGLASTYLLKSRVAGVFIITIMVLPIFFLGAIIKKFTRKIFIQLSPGHFAATVLNANGGEVQSEVNLNVLRSYSIQIPNDKFSTIKFTFEDGKSFEYSFFQKQQSDESITTDELISSFHSLIREYNNTSTTNKIIFKPSFYASNAGLFCIIGLSVFFIIAIYLASLSKTKALPVSLLFGFILILQLILKRKKELDYYKRMS